MALKKKDESYDSLAREESLSEKKAKEVFSRKEGKEKKILTTFSIEPSFKEELEDLFEEMGLGWAAGIRFALKESNKKYSDQYYNYITNI